MFLNFIKIARKLFNLARFALMVSLQPFSQQKLEKFSIFTPYHNFDKSHFLQQFSRLFRPKWIPLLFLTHLIIHQYIKLFVPNLSLNTFLMYCKLQAIIWTYLFLSQTNQAMQKYVYWKDLTLHVIHWQG